MLTPVTPVAPHEAVPFLGADAGANDGYGTGSARSDDSETLLGSDSSQTPSLPDDAKYAGRDEIHTTWQHETRFLVRSSLPIIVMYVLWQSMCLSGLFIVGRLGNAELGAINLAVRFPADHPAARRVPAAG